MRTPPDLHPDDLATRENLRDILRQTREDAGLSQRAFGELMGVGPTTVWHMEANTNWQLSTVQRWAYHLGLWLVLYPDFLPIQENMNLMRPQDPKAAMAFDRDALKDAMIEARRARRFTQERIGEKLGISENGVGAMEKEKDNLLISVQRYLRAIDSSLVVELEDWPGEAMAA